ncbi:MAG: PQQ-binding-like beta-propeller repeat protein [Phycisphaeraceae bacterium]|nr:PQQ-binding-like beta-propeller repeat protein [Phycisphaeraceae bacterium]
MAHARVAATLIAFLLAGGAIAQTEPEPVAPSEPNADPAPTPRNGHIVVSTRGDGSIVLIDPTTFRVWHREAAPVGLHEIAASADGRLVVGSAYGSGPRHQTPDQRLLVVTLPDLDPRTDDAPSVGPLINLGAANSRPNDLAFLPGGSRVICTSEVARTLLIVDVDAALGATPDPDTLEVGAEAITSTIPFQARAGHMLAITPDAARAFVPSVADRTVTTVDLATGQIVATTIAGEGAEGVAASPDASTVWVSCHRAEVLAVLDASTGQRTHTVPCPGYPFRVRFTPDATRVVVSCPGDNRVRIFDAASRTLVHTIDVGEGTLPTSIAVSPDGALAAVVCASAEAVAIIDLAEGEVLTQVRVGPIPDGLTWAPHPPEMTPDSDSGATPSGFPTAEAPQP